MSPIEHVWDALDRRIQQRVPVPANIQQLHTAIEQEWSNIPQATINNLINSMWRRCVGLREANGGHTRYWLVFSILICHTCEVDGLSRQRRSAHYHRFRQICEHYEQNRPFVYIEKVSNLWVQLMKNGGKNKSVAFIILFSVYIYSISQKWVHPSHFCKYFIISFHVTTLKWYFATM